MRKDDVIELGSLIIMGMIISHPQNGGHTVVRNQIKPGESNYYKKQRCKNDSYKAVTHRELWKYLLNTTWSSQVEDTWAVKKDPALYNTQNKL